MTGIRTQHSSGFGNGQTNNEFYKFDKFLWLIVFEVHAPGTPAQRPRTYAAGPYCSREGCKGQLDLTSTLTEHAAPTTFHCPLCNKEYSTDRSFAELRRLALLSYEAKSREAWPVVALDQPPADLKTRDEDERYWLAARIGTKNAKTVGMVYFGDKTNTSGKKGYSQVFVDLDDEQFRHDPTNMDPKEIVARMEVEFIQTSLTKIVKRSPPSKEK